MPAIETRCDRPSPGPRSGCPCPCPRAGPAPRAFLRLLALAFGVAGCAGPGPTPGAGEAAPPVEHAWVVFGADTVQVEVARTEEQRERGLMGRASLADGSGMLFVFPTLEIQGIWMKDTRIPLDAAFLDDQGVVLSIVSLEPQDLTVRWAPAPVRYLLEVPRGWFARHGIAADARAEIVFVPRD